MIRSALIRDFRCFKSAELDDLKRINVITGHNASGKTALLEAIGLAISNNQDIALRYRIWRGTLLAPGSEVNPEYDRQIWKDLFNDFDLAKTVRIKLQGDHGHSRSLVIRYDQKKPRVAVQVSGAPTPLFASPISFEYQKPGKKPWFVRAIPIGNAFHYQGGETKPIEGAFFAATTPPDQVETVDRFTKLSITRESDAISKEIQHEFPFIKGIETGTRAGTGFLFLDVEGVQEKVPVGFVSGGISKIIAILIMICSFKGGVIILDEIENGIFHDRLEPMWGALHRFAVANDVQLFVSTHSAECIDALERASKKFRKDLSFIRIENEGKEKKIVQLDGATMFKVNEIGDIR